MNFFGQKEVPTSLVGRGLDANDNTIVSSLDECRGDARPAWG